MRTRLKVRRRANFTLIEMMIVMFLIALAAGFIGLNIIRAVRQERFLSSVRRVTDRIQMAQDLMLVSSADGVGMDTTLEFTQNTAGTYFCRIGFEGKLPQTRLQTFEQKIELRGVSKVSWEGESEEGSLTFRFSALESHIPLGVFHLLGEGGDERWIESRGYPMRYHSTGRRPAPPEPIDWTRESAALYPLEEQTL